MLIPGRHEASGSYRYGFQGQEKDDEIKGEGNSLNYTFRMHDPRVGRFFAVDPLSPNYPWYTPYSFSGNKVIAYRELEGLEEENATIDFGLFFKATWNAIFGIFGDKKVVKEAKEDAIEKLNFDALDQINELEKQAYETQLKTVFGVAEITGELYSTGEIVRMYHHFIEGDDVYGVFNKHASFDEYGPKGDAVWSVVGLVLPQGADQLATPVKRVVKKGLSGFKFAQTAVNKLERFSDEGIKIFSEIVGEPIETIDDLAKAIIDGKITPKEIPLDYVVRNGENVILNTRTSTALNRAGIPMSEWYGIDQTDIYIKELDKTFNDLAEEQIKKNYKKGEQLSSTPLD